MPLRFLLVLQSDVGEPALNYLPLFVYGTLKPGEPNYDFYLAGRTIDERPASIEPAALYTERPYSLYPYLVLDPAFVEPHDRVYGTLVVLAPEHYEETLRRIDELEDCKPFSPWSLYKCVARCVETAEGPVEAWMYITGPQASAAIRTGRLSRIVGGVWTARRDQ